MTAPDARHRILYVDDDRTLRDLVLVAADPVCFHLDVAEGTPAAEILLARDRFDLIVCGTIPTMLGLADLAMRVGTKIVAMAVDPFMTGGRRTFVVVPRPDTASDLRAVLLDSMRSDPEKQAAASG